MKIDMKSSGFEVTGSSADSLFAALDQLNNGFAIYDKDLKLIFANEVARNYLPILYANFDTGLSFKESVALQVKHFFPAMGVDDCQARVDFVMEKIENEGTTEVHAADGRVINSTYKKMKNGQYVVISTDISQRVQDAKSAEYAREEERDKLISRLTDSNEELERFAFVCSHDLQEPLRMIRSFSEKLQVHIANSLEGDEKGKKYFQFITDGAERAQNLIQDILAYSSIGSDTQTLESFDSQDLIDIVTLNMAANLEANNGRITHDVMPELTGNKTQILQLFQNLVVNGLKYQNSDTAPHVHIGVEDNGIYYEFSVKDNGIGMQAKHLGKIFEVFQRLHGISKYAGTGVGLSICKKIVQRHGGDIWVNSEKGVGSIFYFTLLKPESEKGNS